MNAISAIHSQAILHRHTVTQAQPADQTDGNKPLTNPAKSARAALIDRPDLAGKPFGSLVSLFAQGLPLPPVENAVPVQLAPETGTTDTSGDTTAATV